MIDSDYGLEVLAEPDGFEEPVNLEQAKAHLAIVDDTSSDVRIADLIKAARQYAEEWTGRKITPCTYRLTLRRLPDDDEIRLHGGCVRSVDQVAYRDAGLVWRTLASSIYEEVLSFTPPRIELAPQAQWPSVGSAGTVLRIDYQAGWETPAGVPADLQHAIKLIVGAWFAQPGDSPKQDLPDGLKRVLDHWRIKVYG